MSKEKNNSIKSLLLEGKSDTLISVKMSCSKESVLKIRRELEAQGLLTKVKEDWSVI